jgi:hypothetical protein
VEGKPRLSQNQDRMGGAALVGEIKVPHFAIAAERLLLILLGSLV